MQIKRCFLIALLAGGAAYGQDQQQPAAGAPKPEATTPATASKPPAAASQGAQKKEEAAPQGVLKPGIYVRRFSVGVSLSVLPLNQVPNRSSSVVTSSPPFDAIYTTTAAPHRIGWGGTGQIAITDRFALGASFLIRHFGYKFNSDIFTGVDNPNTIEDERTHTVKNQNTQVKVYDIPVALRFYTKGRHESGPRGFFELGGVLRSVKKVSSSTDTTINDGTTSCCDTTPAGARRNTKGLVAGAGLQLIDPVGIRVVPEVRYTYWLSDVFNNLTNVSKRHQIEAIISLTF